MQLLFTALLGTVLLTPPTTDLAAPPVQPPPEPEFTLVGTWQGTMIVNDIVTELRPTFKADGSYVMTASSSLGVIVQRGTYTYADNILTLTPAGGYSEAGMVKVVNVYEFVYQRGPGRQITFHRQ
jgi:hypothetical protein